MEVIFLNLLEVKEIRRLSEEYSEPLDLTQVLFLSDRT
jgi:hypothetical protein